MPRRFRVPVSTPDSSCLLYTSLDLADVLHLLQRNGVLQEGQVVGLQLLGQTDGVGRSDALVHIVHQADLIAHLAADAVEQFDGITDVGIAVQIHAGLCAHRCTGRGMAVLAAAVTAALAADGLDADLTVLGDVLADLGQVAAIDVAVDVYKRQISLNSIGRSFA